MSNIAFDFFPSRSAANICAPCSYCGARPLSRSLTAASGGKQAGSNPLRRRQQRRPPPPSTSAGGGRRASRGEESRDLTPPKASRGPGVRHRGTRHRVGGGRVVQRLCHSAQHTYKTTDRSSLDLAFSPLQTDIPYRVYSFKTNQMTFKSDFYFMRLDWCHPDQLLIYERACQSQIKFTVSSSDLLRKEQEIEMSTYPLF